MTRIRTLLGCTILAAVIAAPFPGNVALAQDNNGFLDNLFGGDRQAQQNAPPAPMASVDNGGGGVSSRIDRVENALRQLTGVVEQLQHQNQMLQMQLKRMQDDTEYRFQHMGHGGGAPPPGGPGQRSERSNPGRYENGPGQPQPLHGQANGSGGSGDAFNPAQHPSAPGVPRSLSSEVPGGQGMNEPVGAPGGREAGQPLDLNTLAANPPMAPPPNGAPPGAGMMPAQQGQLPPPPPRNPSATGVKLATLPPSASPKDEYELGYGYVLHKDYALAAQTFSDFLDKHPKDRLAADANYWLGESYYQQQNYDEAARAFLAVSTKYKHFSKAPDALLRLGQSLAALHHKEAACATLGEVKNKFPHASGSVRRGVAQELKRAHC